MTSPEPCPPPSVAPPAETVRQRSGRFRECVGQFATGVTVVTVATPQGPRGATVNAFASISLDPPLVMVSLSRRSRLCSWLAGAPFGVNILSAVQRDLGLHFAGFAGGGAVTVAWEDCAAAPRLCGTVGFLACAPWAAYDGGDHVVYLGEVRHLDWRDADPLVFHRGAFRELGRDADPHVWIGSLDGPADGTWQLHRHAGPRSRRTGPALSSTKE